MNKQNKGITLVALVITIIVLIILAGVSINAIFNDGLIGNSKNASREYEKTKQDEQIAIGDLVQEIENVKGKWVQAEDGTITHKDYPNDPSKTFTVGEVVNYTPQTEVTKYTVYKEESGMEEDQVVEQVQDIEWKVIGVNADNRIEIIGDKPTNEFKMYGEYGLDNSVKVLNNVCNVLYGNSKISASGKIAKSNDIVNYIDSSLWRNRMFVTSECLTEIISGGPMLLRGCVLGSYPGWNANDAICFGMNGEPLVGDCQVCSFPVVVLGDSFSK